jgi:hypothetical protein
VSETIELHTDSTVVDLPRSWLGTVKVEAEAQDAEAAFVGIAPSDDAESYLRGVASSTVVDSFGDDGEPAYDFVDGDSPRNPPTEETFWVASTSGQGRQTLTWEPSDGSWTLVAMNAEGTAPVDVDVAIGATVPALDEVALILLVTGLVFLGLSAVILVAALRRPSVP